MIGVDSLNGQMFVINLHHRERAICFYMVLMEGFTQMYFFIAYRVNNENGLNTLSIAQVVGTGLNSVCMVEFLLL